jgi:DNA invertase Pin-like site-specific DNA recombinase
MYKATIMYFFYSRVSTVGQNVNRQISNFKSHNGFNAQNLYVDKVQGNVPFLERPEASKLYDRVTEHNADNATIVVDSIDRLGRNLIDILKTIERFTTNGINLKSIKEGFETLTEDGKENPTAKIVVSLMGSIAEMQRNIIKERTAEGIQIARAEGKFRGRKIGSVQSTSRLLERHPVIVKKLNKGLTVREVAEIVGKSTTTVMKVKKVL